MQHRRLSKIHGPDDLRRLSVDELPQLAAEIRQAIFDQVSRTGGHFAPNLGAVDLTLALHYVFDFAYDRLLFDVGHQCYTHKLLTGRGELFGKLRQKGGMSGFPDPAESPYDLFSVGHAGTSISTGVGMARADTLLGSGDRRVVAFIGDASIVNGVAMEGLNNAGTLMRQFLVVLNDNGMSIAKPQGALARVFDGVRISSHYESLKSRAKQVVERLPVADTIGGIYHRLGSALQGLVHPHHPFGGFGLLTLGPIDGHDIKELVAALREVRDLDRPVLLHCKTVKGQGFDFSTGDPEAFHSPKPFTVEGCQVVVKQGGRSFTSAFGDALIDLMERDERVYAVTAAMPDGTGINRVMKRFPQRSLDTGICESHAMAMCAGMAKSGLKPFFAVYSTFAQRALDQVFQEVALQGLPVRVCMDRAGFVGGDGAVHHGFVDISIFKPFPGSVLLAASDEPNLRAALEFMRSYEEGATFLRYPRDSVARQPLQTCPPPFELGRANLVLPAKRRAGPQLAILAYGTEVLEAVAAVRALGALGQAVAVYDARFAKPVDAQLLRDLIESEVAILTVEEHATIGGFGSSVLELCNDERLSTDGVWRMGMPARWFGPDSREHQLADAGLDAAAIAERVRTILASWPGAATSTLSGRNGSVIVPLAGGSRVANSVRPAIKRVARPR